MKKGRLLALAFVVSCPVSLLVDACRAATQVTLDVRYAGVCAEKKNVAIMVGADPYVIEATRIPAHVFTASTTDCKGGEIGTLVITPDGDSTRGAVAVIAGIDRPAEACTRDDGYFGCIIARRTFSFEEHTGLVLPIVLEPSCKNVPCDAISTCKNGACVSSEVTCHGSDCSDFGTRPDGAPATTDAPTSSDAVAMQDAGPGEDARPDAPIDAPADVAPGNCSDKTFYCPPYTTPTSACMPNACFFRPDGVSYSASCTPFNDSGAVFSMGCAASRQCGAGAECCWPGSGSGAQQTSCALGCPPIGRIACIVGCDCPLGFGCVGAGDAGVSKPPFLRVCAQGAASEF